MKLDRVNAIILKELLKDGRKTFTEIAQQCGESMEVVANRYRQMKKQGIIVGATVHNSCACYDSSFVVDFNVNTRPHKYDVATKLLRDFPNVIAVYPVGMNPNLNSVFTIKSIQELERTKQAIKELPDVLEVDTDIWIGTRNTPHNLSALNIGEIPHTETSNILKQNNYPQLDEIDKYIMEKLVVDSRIPFSRIAGELKISTDTVSKRYERLKKNNHLKAVIRIDPTKIGYKAFAIFKMTFSEDSLAKSIETLSLMQDFNFIHKVSGKFDCMASLMIRDIDQFTDVQEKILNMNYMTNIEIGVAKIFNAWPLPREFISTF